MLKFQAWSAWAAHVIYLKIIFPLVVTNLSVSVICLHADLIVLIEDGVLLVFYLIIHDTVIIIIIILLFI